MIVQVQLDLQAWDRIGAANRIVHLDPPTHEPI